MTRSGLPVDGGRLWADIMALAAITDPQHPYTRRSFSPLFMQGRAWLQQRFAEAGLHVRIDAGGNLIGRLPGHDPAAGTIMLGSHSDTVPSGGRFDGIAGVIAGLAQQFISELDRRTADIATACRVERSRYGLIMNTTPAQCDESLRKFLTQSADRLGLTTMPLASGAGHDSAFIARIAPAAMVFVACRDGKSHTPEGWAEPDALAAGCAVLWETVRRIDEAMP